MWRRRIRHTVTSRRGAGFHVGTKKVIPGQHMSSVTIPPNKMPKCGAGFIYPILEETKPNTLVG